MRIIGGKFKGKHFNFSHSDIIRPTSDRLKQALFNILDHKYREDILNAWVLDLFSGTGALGFEALSRGAEYVTFIDQGREACNILKTIQKNLSIEQKTSIIQKDVRALKQNPFPFPFNLVFCDPPYKQKQAPLAFETCVRGGWLKKGALIIIEEEQDESPLPMNGFTEIETRHYGGTTSFTFARYLG